MQAGSPARDALSGRRLDAIAALVGLPFLLPVIYLAGETLTGGGISGPAWSVDRTLVPLRNSVVLATTVGFLCGVTGTGLAWLTTRTDLAGRRLLRVVLPLPLVIPSFVGATAFLAGFGRGGLIEWMPRLTGFWGATVVLTLLSYPYVYMPVAARLRTLDASLEEAALVLDGRRWRTIRQVVLPQLRSAIVAGVLLVYLYVLSDFGAVALMRYDAITRAIFSARLADRGTALALGLLLAVLALGVAWLARRWNPSGPSSSDRGPQRLYSLGRARLGWSAASWALVAVAIAVPIAVFLTWVVTGSATIGVGYSGWGDDLGFLLEPLVNSTIAAVLAAVAAAVVVLPVAYADARRRTRLSSAAATSVAAGFALPGLVLALAIVFWALAAPRPLSGLYQTMPLLVLAYVLHFGAQAMTASRAALTELPAAYDEAGQMLGASRWKRLRTIELPLVFPAILAGGGLVLLSTLKELPATLLLAPIGFETLATQIWGAAEDGFFAEAGITSIVLILLSGVLTWALVLRSDPTRDRQPRHSRA